MIPTEFPNKEPSSSPLVDLGFHNRFSLETASLSIVILTSCLKSMRGYNAIIFTLIVTMTISMNIATIVYLVVTITMAIFFTVNMDILDLTVLKVLSQQEGFAWSTGSALICKYWDKCNDT